jgi:serine/threonine protein phosphatase PrpC
MLAKIMSAGRTDIGRKRTDNQDQYLIADLNKSMLVQSTSLDFEAQSRLYGMSHGKLFMVADGMGGHQGGNRASRMAINMLVNQLLNNMHWYSSQDEDEAERESGFIEDLKRLMQLAHEAIEKDARHTVDMKGMGTTLTVAYIAWPWMYVLHAGDSRCYLCRRGELKQLTKDHTVSNQLIEKGGMTAAEANSSPWSNVLYNALGAGAPKVVPDVQKVQLEPGDTVLLCTDGLYRHLQDAELANILVTELEPQETCRSLIELANFRGGADNITAVVARLGAPQEFKPKTRVATEITLERLLGDTTGNDTREMPVNDTREVPAGDTREVPAGVRPKQAPISLPDTGDFSQK